MPKDSRNPLSGFNPNETTVAQNKLKLAAIIVSVLAIAALAIGFATGNYQPLVLIILIVFIVIISWLWSVLVDRMFHKLRYWNKSQAPQPVVLEQKTSAARHKHPLRFTSTGKTAFTITNMLNGGLLYPFYTGDTSEDPDERMSALKLDIAASLRKLGRELREAGRAMEADEALAEARSIDPYEDTDAEAGIEKYANPLFRAIGLMRTGNFTEAVSELSGKGKAKKSPTALYSLGLCQAMSGDFNKAADSLVGAANAGAESSMLRTALGTVYAQSGETEEAGKQFRAGLAMDEESAGAMAGLGYLLVKSGKPDEARAFLDEALSRHPNFMPARFAFAYILWANSDPSGAAREFNRIRQSVSLEAEEAEVIDYNIGACQLAAGQHSEAIKTLEAVSSPGTDTLRVLADAYDQGGQQQKSREILAQIGTDAGAEDLHIRVIRSLREEGKLDEAESEINQIIEGGNTSAPVLTEKAAILEAHGDKNGAERLYSEAIGKDKEYAEAAKGLGRLLLEKGLAKEAVNRLKAATNSSSADVDTYFLLGKAHLMNGKALLALEALKDASLRSGGKRGDISWALGKALLDAGRARDAAEELRKARKLLPAEPEIDRDLGYANHRTRNYKDAVSNLQAYLQARPDANDTQDVQNLISKLSSN